MFFSIRTPEPINELSAFLKQPTAGNGSEWGNISWKKLGATVEFSNGGISTVVLQPSTHDKDMINVNINLYIHTMYMF